MPATIINHLGFNFDEAIDVKGRLSISDLFPKSKKRCGIYLLNLSDNTFYIGQAVDAVRRFSQHRKNYDNIVRYWFIEIKKENLNKVEEQLIKDAEKLGLLVINKTHVSNVIGETDLDEVITPLEQHLWLQKSIRISDEKFDLYSQIDIKYIVKYQYNFEKLKQKDDYSQVRRILKNYIEKCIPAFKKTEQSFWSLSCMPSTNVGTYPRYFCLNINAMEVFVLGLAKKEKKHFCFIITTTKFLKNNSDIEQETTKKYQSLVYQDSTYRAAGNDQICLGFEDLDEFESFFETEKEIVDSIKEMNLRLMRKGGTIYSPYHCFDLVKDVLS